jgi:hypothetical protein
MMSGDSSITVRRSSSPWRVVVHADHAETLSAIAGPCAPHAVHCIAHAPLTSWTAAAWLLWQNRHLQSSYVIPRVLPIPAMLRERSPRTVAAV